MAKSKFNYTKYLFILVLILLFLYFMSQKESDKDVVIENFPTGGIIGIVGVIVVAIILGNIFLRPVLRRVP